MNLYNGRPTTLPRKDNDNINKGHGERFFRAFDMAFNLSPILISREAMQRWDDFYSSLESTQVVNGGRLDSTPYTSTSPSCSLKKTQAGLSDHERLTFPIGAFPACSNPNDDSGVLFCSHARPPYNQLSQSSALVSICLSNVFPDYVVVHEFLKAE